MSLARTTLRLDANLKEAAERQVSDDATTLQAIFNDTLAQYLDKRARTKAHKIVFYAHDLGETADNLKRSDFQLNSVLSGR